MNKRKYTLFLAIGIPLIIAVVWAATTLFQPAQPKAGSGIPVGTAVGEPAPDLILHTVDGQGIKISDYKGKVVLVNAFASWCGPCRTETPELVKVYEAHKEDVQWIGLNFGEDKAAIEAYRDDFLVPYPLILDPDGRIAEFYRPIGLPTSYFIDPDGIIRYVHTGPITQDFVESLIADLQAGREPDPFKSPSVY